MLCNYLQNVAAITYIFVLQLSTFLFYNKQKFQEQRIWKEEEEEDEQIYAALVGLEHMREYAGENEKIILLIDEQKSILDNIRLRKSLRKESKVVQTKNLKAAFSFTPTPIVSLTVCIYLLKGI